MLTGKVVYSPIVHGFNLGIEEWKHDDWLAYDFEILAICSALYFCEIPGWEKSKGMARELDFAHTNGIKIKRIWAREIEVILKKTRPSAKI